MRTPYLSASDGKDHTAASELIVYSGEYGCADTLLAAFFDYQAESLSGELLKTLASQKFTVSGLRTMRFRPQTESFP